MSHISAACAAACTRIETDTSKAGGCCCKDSDHNLGDVPADTEAELTATASAFHRGNRICPVHCRLQRVLWALPSSVLESLVPLVLRCQTAAIAKNRSHKGLVTALQCLLGPNLKRLDIGALFHGCRLYGDVNSRCTILMSISNLTF